MRDALRRILWIVPMMFAVSILAFWGLAHVVPPRPAQSPSGDAEGSPPRSRLPLFINPNPRNVRALTEQAVREIAENPDSCEAAQRELARLGGAALPFVLPRLDSLAPDARSRVALSLEPIGRRMQVGSEEELGDPEAAVLFWHRFWEDRAIDFRPAVVKRAVRRLAVRSTASRVSDIVQLDTFALSELVESLEPVETPEDAQRVRRLTALTAHITGQPWRLSQSASVDEARALVSKWEHWWLRNSADFGTFEGAPRLAALMTETEYGKWLSGVVEGDLGTTTAGRPVLDVLAERGPVTGTLVAMALLAGLVTAVLIGLAGAAQAARPLDLGVGLLAVVLASLPTAALAQYLLPEVAEQRSVFGPALVLLIGTASLVSRYYRVAAETALLEDYSRTLRALGASPVQTAVRSVKNSSMVVASLGGVILPTLLSATFVAEYVWRLPGLGLETLAAVRHKDVAWLMLMALLSVGSVSLVQAVSDLLLTALDPRSASLLTEGRRHPE